VSTMLTPLSAKQIHDVEAAMVVVSAALEDLQSSSLALSANAKALRRQKK
jgi:hypothetical protein